ncbi:hypothetical protein EDF56_101439 [Novosphingobium sp. PhB165]|uniref:hypothetical protein n=1 Tax=Novosphingobium sp. PhB165 TaxID=2485105 RepID=UPI0010529BE2|nr:hypothetical protein [Novosphingobium sp. PhB165]TCM21764.1 hypothetical protein EDF56_101439 [Novosphingobium sp. PhB165]
MNEVSIEQVVERIEAALARLDKVIPETMEQRARDARLRISVEQALGELDELLAPSERRARP